MSVSASIIFKCDFCTIEHGVAPVKMAIYEDLKPRMPDGWFLVELKGRIAAQSQFKLSCPAHREFGIIAK